MATRHNSLKGDLLRIEETRQSCMAPTHLPKNPRGICFKILLLGVLGTFHVVTHTSLRGVNLVEE